MSTKAWLVFVWLSNYSFAQKMDHFLSCPASLYQTVTTWSVLPLPLKLWPTAGQKFIYYYYYYTGQRHNVFYFADRSLTHPSTTELLNKITWKRMKQRSSARQGNETTTFGVKRSKVKVIQWQR